MKPDNSLDRRKKIVIFSLILLATVGIASYLIATVLQKEEYAPVSKAENTKRVVVSPVNYNMLLADNELLTGRLKSLLQLDQKYADLLTEAHDKKLLDSINQQIYVQEEIFRSSIDSIFLNTPNQADSGLNKLFINIVSSYKTILQNRQSVSSLRNVINLDKKSLNPGEMAMVKNQNELQEKNNRIILLESTLSAMSVNKGNATPEKSAGSNENIAALKDNMNEQENKIAVLTSTNNSLKQENDRLIKQNDASKTTGQAETSFKNKTAALQQRVDELNAELRLARVDCNLSRVDADQIISNSRQRKELLSEASGILTSLAKSDDAEIRKKVHDKIARLNQVAANSRD